METIIRESDFQDNEYLTAREQFEREILLHKRASRTRYMPEYEQIRLRELNAKLFTEVPNILQP